MPFISSLLAWANVPFTVALGVAVGFALLQMTGLLGLLAGGGDHEGDADGGHEADHEAGHDGGTTEVTKPTTTEVTTPITMETTTPTRRSRASPSSSSPGSAWAACRSRSSGRRTPWPSASRA